MAEMSLGTTVADRKLERWIDQLRELLSHWPLLRVAYRIAHLWGERCMFENQTQAQAFIREGLDCGGVDRVRGDASLFRVPDAIIRRAEGKTHEAKAQPPAVKSTKKSIDHALDLLIESFGLLYVAHFSKGDAPKKLGYAEHISEYVGPHEGAIWLSRGKWKEDVQIAVQLGIFQGSHHGGGFVETVIDQKWKDEVLQNRKQKPAKAGDEVLKPADVPVPAASPAIEVNMERIVFPDPAAHFHFKKRARLERLLRMEQTVPAGKRYALKHWMKELVGVEREFLSESAFTQALRRNLEEGFLSHTSGRWWLSEDTEYWWNPDNLRAALVGDESAPEKVPAPPSPEPVAEGARGPIEEAPSSRETELQRQLAAAQDRIAWLEPSVEQANSRAETAEATAIEFQQRAHAAEVRSDSIIRILAARLVQRELGDIRDGELQLLILAAAREQITTET